MICTSPGMHVLCLPVTALLMKTYIHYREAPDFYEGAWAVFAFPIIVFTFISAHSNRVTAALYPCYSSSSNWLLTVVFSSRGSLRYAASIEQKMAIDSDDQDVYVCVCVRKSTLSARGERVDIKACQWWHIFMYYRTHFHFPIYEAYFTVSFTVHFLLKLGPFLHS